MTRDAFKEAVFARDLQCVVCGREGKDAHHIMERRLFPDGGYDLDNGVLLCGLDHLRAEGTTLSPEELREKAGITRVLLPPHLHPDERYDKWGNMYLPDGRRLRGELFYDESVQKILQRFEQLDQFVAYVKYPRTPHLPWSPGATDDDLSLTKPPFRAGEEVMVLEKMDGENTTMYQDYIHARSIDMSYHQSRTWVKNLHSKIAHEIPDTWRICGENLYAKHAIRYRDLPSYFMVFSIWDGDTCLSWHDTVAYCDVLGLDTVPAFWGPVTYNDDLAQRLRETLFHSRYEEDGVTEGYVMRSQDSFKLKDFQRHMAKYVRAGHIGPDQHNWKAKAVIPNLLREKTKGFLL